MNDHQNGKRVVVLVDMDCFYCQVEVAHDRSLAGKPVAVVQYNSWRGGGIIAVNYEARAKGVDRHMRGDDAVQKCPDLNLVRVSELHGKADLSKYRTASQKVFEVLSEFSSCVQRASIDEAYIDLTNAVNDYITSNQNSIKETDLPNTFVQGYSDQSSIECRQASLTSWLLDVYNNELQDDYLLHLTVGAMMTEKLRESVFNKTGFRCSAGIASNKILAKLACGLHKPNQQTLLPPSSIPHLFESIPIKKIRNLGGKLGSRVRREFNCEFMSDLAAIPLSDLRKKFDEKTSNFLYQISKGIDNESVESRLIAKSIGSCKSFPLGLKIREEVQHWLSTLMNDIVEKLEYDHEKNKRKATLITVSVRYSNKETNLPTSQCGEVTSYNYNKLLDTAYSMLCIMTENQKTLNWKNSLLYLGVSIGKFIEINVKSSIDNYFTKGVSKEENECESSKLESGPSGSSGFTSINKQLNSNSNELLSNVPSTSTKTYSNTKKNEPCTSDIKNIKTMFAEMKNSSNLIRNCIETDNNLSVTKEKQTIKQNKLSSFFGKKLESISPVKSVINDQTSVKIPSPTESFFSKKLEIVSPSKYVQNDKDNKIPDRFFSKKLEIASLSKNPDSVKDQSLITENSSEDVPTMLLCERCNEMVDINLYDEHFDHHVAIELNKSLNATNIIQPMVSDILSKSISVKKTNERGHKRKKKLQDNSSSTKKSNTNISSYFKPVLNP